MKKFWKKKERAVKPVSPDDGELLAYLDGELAPERQAEIRQLLAGDWRLRVRLAELERDIETYVKATHPQRPGEAPPFEEVWRGVSSRLTELLEPLPVEAEPRLLRRGKISLTARFGSWRSWVEALSRQPMLLRWSVAASVGLMIVTGLTFWLLSSEHLRAVSAEELLQRATRSEAAQINQVAEPVVYRRVQVKRTGANESVTWESWKQAGRNQFRQRVADGQGWRFIHSSRANEQATPSLIAEIEAVLEANHLDLQRPLSADAFAEWRTTIRRKSEIIRELALPGSSANDGLKLTTIAPEPYAVNAVIEATLTVRKTDWHTVAQRLKVQGENGVREYELSETAYEVLPLHALTVFADLAPTPSPAATILPSPSPSRVPAVASPAPLPTVVPTEAALKEAEVAALFALHQVQADLGEQLETVRDPSGKVSHWVVVRGLVETEARKQQLVEALRNIPLITTRLQTVEEAARQAALKQSARAAQSAPVNEPVNTSTSGAPARNAFEQRLMKYFAELESSRSADERRTIDLKIAQLSNEVVSESSAALSETWALRRLLERYAAESELSPIARQRIEEMSANHVARLKAQSRKLRARLEPALISIAGDEAPVVSAPTPAESTKQAQALALFRAVEQAQQLTHRLFAGAGVASAPARQSLLKRTLLNGIGNDDRSPRRLQRPAHGLPGPALRCGLETSAPMRRRPPQPAAAVPHLDPRAVRCPSVSSLPVQANA